jgi:hypothetical protein
MLRATKNQAKKLKELAKGLPLTTYTVPKFGQVEMGGKTFIAKVGHDMHKVNHERRIVEAFNIGGMETVKEYCREVMALDNIAQQPIVLQPKFYIPL